MPVSIHPLSPSDLEAAALVLSSAFGRSGNWIFELRLNRSIQPDGYFGAYKNGELVGMVGSTIYSTFAHVGLMGVHQAFQRQGVGHALMEHLLTWLEDKKIPLFMLDASPYGQPLYEKLGFATFERVLVFQRQQGYPPHQHSPEIQPISHQDLDLVSRCDQQVFGADRRRVLQAMLDSYPNRAFMLRGKQDQVNGYLFAQERRIGPWVMPGKGGEALLLEAAISLPFADPISVVVPEVNPDSIRLLERHGFSIVRVNRRMAIGVGMPVGQRDRIFGQSSLSLG